MLDFPANPILNQEYTFNEITWVWNGSAWYKKLQMVSSTPYIINVDLNTNGELVFTYTDNTTQNVGVVTGENGVSISNAEINENDELVLTYSNGVIVNLGVVVGPSGPSGTTITITDAYINTNGELILVFSTGSSINTGNVVGPTGATGPSGAAGVDVTNASIDTNGDLIITLSDSSIINAGNAVGPTGAISFSYGITPPINPQYGDIWLNTSTGNIFVYITDGNSDQWIEPFGPTGATGTTGATGAAGVDVTNASIDTNGDLIITLSDSSIINAGNAVGPVGPAGNLSYSPEIRKWFFS